MFKIIKPLIAVTVLAAFCLLTPGLSHAQSTTYCYNHPYDNSQTCFCYHHPKECNGAYGYGSGDPVWNRAYGSAYPGWNRDPNWNNGWVWNRADSGYGPYDRFFPNASFNRNYAGHSGHFEQGRPAAGFERGRSYMHADAGHSNQVRGGHHYERN
jgi:hypothetical protein